MTWDDEYIERLKKFREATERDLRSFQFIALDVLTKTMKLFNEAEEKAVKPNILTVTIEQGWSDGREETFYFEIYPN